MRLGCAASISAIVRELVRTLSTKHGGGEHGRTDARATRRVLEKNITADVDHHGSVGALQLRDTRFCRAAEPDQDLRLPARLLHGGAGLADLLRSAVLLERERAEQDRRRIRRRRRLTRERPTWPTRPARGSSTTSAKSTAATPGASSAS